MIRDPSDGSVYERPKIEISGLPKIEEKSGERLRLEKSREWLERWKKDLDSSTLPLSDEQKSSG